MLRYKYIDEDGEVKSKACRIENFVVTDSRKIQEISLPNEDYLCKNQDYNQVVLERTMKRNKEGELVPVTRILPRSHVLVNNPNIPIFPANPTTSTQGPRISPISVVPVTKPDDKDQLNKNKDRFYQVCPISLRTAKDLIEKARQNSFKRTSTNQICERPLKMRRVSHNLNVTAHSLHLENGVAHPLPRNTSSSNGVPQSMAKDLNIVVDRTTGNDKVIIPNTNQSVYFGVVDEISKKKIALPKETTIRIYSLLAHAYQEELTKLNTNLQPLSPTPEQSVDQIPTIFKHATITCVPTVPTQSQSVVPQQPTTSTTKQSVTQPNVKPTVACQSPYMENVKDFCKTCNYVMSNNGNCPTCRMSKLKGVPVTRNDAIDTLQINDDEEKNKNIDKEKNKDAVKDIDKIEINEPANVCTISLDDDEDNDNVEPNTNSEDRKIFAELNNVVDDYETYQLTADRLDNSRITPVKIMDYRRLSINRFLNDTIVEFYLNYWLCRKLTQEDRKRTQLFDTFFYTSLSTKKGNETSSRHDRVKKWTKKINIFDKDFIFIPINENQHWFMAVICYPGLTGPVHYEDGTQLKTLYEDDFGDCKRPIPRPCEPNPERDEADGNTEDLRYYPVFSHDAQSYGNYYTDIENLKKKNRIPVKRPVILIFDSLNEYGNTSRARIVATLREWLSEEYRTKYNGAVKDFSIKSMKGTVVKVPQQTNNTDCGLFVLHYFQKFFECPIIDYNCPILHLENWFAADDVSKNCRKRREVQLVILNVMKELGRSLPRGYSLPEISFSSQKPQQRHVTPFQPHLPQSYMQQIQSQTHFYNNQVDEDIYDYSDNSENGDVDEEDEGEDESDE